MKVSLRVFIISWIYLEMWKFEPFLKKRFFSRKCYRSVERNELFSHVKKYHRVWRTYRCKSVKISHLHSCIDLARNKYCLRGLFLTRQKNAIILPSINRRNSTQIYSYFSSVLDNLIMPMTCRALSGLRQWNRLSWNTTVRLNTSI